MQNPYASPTTSCSATQSDTRRNAMSATLGFIVSFAGVWTALLCGQVACWIRGGWLDFQMQRGIGDLRLPMYFWFIVGCSFATAFVIALAAIPITRSGFSFRFALSMYGICSLATVFYEILKPKHIIEPPTHAIIVLTGLYSIFILVLAANRFVAKPAPDKLDFETRRISK